MSRDFLNRCFTFHLLAVILATEAWEFKLGNGDKQAATSFEPKPETSVTGIKYSSVPTPSYALSQGCLHSFGLWAEVKWSINNKNTKHMLIYICPVYFTINNYNK